MSVPVTKLQKKTIVEKWQDCKEIWEKNGDLACD